MKTRKWIGGILALGLCACGGSQGYVIQGEVTGFPDSTMMVLRNIDVGEDIDSAWVIDGRFQMKGVFPEEPHSCWITTVVDQQSIWTLMLIGNESIHITGDISDFPRHVNVSGSTYHDQWMEYYSLTVPHYDKRDSLMAAWPLSDDPQSEEQRKTLQQEIMALDREIDSIDKDYLFNHTDTYAGLIRLGYMMYTYPKDTVQMLFDRMSASLQESSKAKKIRTYLESKRVNVGDSFFDFEAQDQDGNPVHLSDWVGKDGKYILLEFTSAGCVPCMMAAKEMRKMVETFSDSLQILSFSMDKNPEEWQASLQRDSVCWPSLWSAEEADRSAVSIPYNVRGYPIFFVIDPQGVVISRWNGFDADRFTEKIEHLRNK